MTDTKDLLGNAMTTDEQDLLAAYRKLHAMSSKQDLPPAALMNIKQAMVLLWNACIVTVLSTMICLVWMMMIYDGVSQRSIRNMMKPRPC